MNLWNNSSHNTGYYYYNRGDTLYSLTWWKDENQFYQYIPSKPNPTVVFTVPGISVNVSTNEKVHKKLKVSIPENLLYLTRNSRYVIYQYIPCKPNPTVVFTVPGISINVSILEKKCILSLKKKNLIF